MQKTAQKKTQSVPDSKEAPLVREIEPMKETKVTVNIPLIIAAVAIIAAGTITGFVLAKSSRETSSGSKLAIGGGSLIGGSGGKTYGKCDKNCKDTASGILREGGTESGEGTHHLERDGGPSQNVYLTSANVDLDEFLDKTVTVKGETFAAETAGWLIDVGQLEVQ